MGTCKGRYPLEEPLRCVDAALNITYACNLSCVGCNRACYVKPPIIPAMTQRHLRKFLDDVDDAGVRLEKVRFVGGEPTIHPAFQKFVGIVSRHSPHCIVGVYSNRRTPNFRETAQAVRVKNPDVRFWGKAKPPRRKVYPWETRTIYVHPRDVGFEPSPHPCTWMEGRGPCGFGADSQGYAICPIGLVIDTLLDLKARAQSIKQLMNFEFAKWQASQLCGNCGAWMDYPESLDKKVLHYDGSPVSHTYMAAMQQHLR